MRLINTLVCVNAHCLHHSATGLQVIAAGTKAHLRYF